MSGARFGGYGRTHDPKLLHTVEELKWYFAQLRAKPNVRVRPADERFERASEAFERPRFYRLYRQWLKEGDSALDAVSSTLLSDALASGAGRVECLVLPHRYDHLAPLVDFAGSGSNGVDQATRNGASKASRPHRRVGLECPSSSVRPRP
jgi:hypothetical protein